MEERVGWHYTRNTVAADALATQKMGHLQSQVLWTLKRCVV